MSPSRRQAPIESGGLGEALDVPHEVRLIDLWDAWLSAEADAGLALRDWSGAADAEKPATYVAYRAALDREEQAAVVLEAFGFSERALAGPSARPLSATPYGRG